MMGRRRWRGIQWVVMIAGTILWLAGCDRIESTDVEVRNATDGPVQVMVWGTLFGRFSEAQLQPPAGARGVQTLDLATGQTARVHIPQPRDGVAVEARRASVRVYCRTHDFVYPTSPWRPQLAAPVEITAAVGDDCPSTSAVISNGTELALEVRIWDIQTQDGQPRIRDWFVGDYAPGFIPWRRVPPGSTVPVRLPIGPVAIEALTRGDPVFCQIYNGAPVEADQSPPVLELSIGANGCDTHEFSLSSPSSPWMPHIVHE